jgi:hypothetical protein
MKRLKQVGAAAFIFFLVKGLLWLLIPGFIVFWNLLSPGSNQ